MQFVWDEDAAREFLEGEAGLARECCAASPPPVRAWLASLAYQIAVGAHSSAHRTTQNSRVTLSPREYVPACLVLC